MADPENDKTPPRGNMVAFGKFMSIDSGKRLPAYDNGRSFAYEATDNRDKSKKFIAIVSDPAQLPRWPFIDSYDGLAETSFLHLVGSGVLHWPLKNKQQYIFLYQGGLGECLVRQGEFSKHSWNHHDVMSFFITPMINLLKEMSEKGFNHGSIRPSNIFYAGGDRNKPIILGDSLSVHSHSTQPAVCLPIDKALAVPMARGNGSLADDIYAFGVTLALFLRKNDEMAGLTDRDIVRKKIEVGSFATIVGVERFHASFLELLRGLLHDDPALRWGLEDIFSWLDGSRMSPPALSRRIKANRPLVFQGKKYLYPDVLALDLQAHPDAVAKIVENQELTQWIEKSFTDKDIEDRYRKALERVASVGSIHDNKDLVVTQISIAFNAMLPIHYKGVNFTHEGIGAGMARAAYDDGDLSVFKDILLLNILDHAVVAKSLSHNEIMAQIKNFDVCRAVLRQKKKGGGIERCIYLMCRNAPCLSPQFKDFFVYNDVSALLTFESLSKKGGQIGLFLDAHCIAFFATHNARLMERVIYDLNSESKSKQIAGNLRFLAIVQHRSKLSTPAIANVFLSALSDVYKTYNNIKLRQKIEDGVKFEAKEGNLAGMSSFIDNDKVMRKDRKAFEYARREYKMLQNEYNQYNARLAHKKTYGVTNGRDAAALVSWVIATGITLMSVLAFLSGYRVF